MAIKFDYTRLLDEIWSLEEFETSRLTFRDIFANYRNGQGLRLTHFGYTCLKKLDYDNWTVSITSGILKPWQKMTLDTEMEWPYYITKKDTTITLFSELDYLDLKMFDGDMKLWCTARRI